MHWSTRAVVAIVCGVVAGTVVEWLINTFLIDMWYGGVSGAASARPEVYMHMAGLAVTALLVLLVYTGLSHLARPRGRRIRCHKCGADLRGVTESRGPQCAEKI